DHHGIGAHGLQCQRGVLERLPLGHARALGRKVDHVRAEALGGGFKRDTRTRGVFKEEVDYRLASQGGKLAHFTVLSGSHGLGSVQNQDRLVTAQVGGAEEVLHARASAALGCVSTTASS